MTAVNLPLPRSDGARKGLGAIAGVGVLLAVLAVAVPDRVPGGVVLEGAVLGITTGLLALGLVLIYRANRIINFAYGAMGSVGATLAVMLYLGRHWNYGLSIVVGLAAGAAVGFAVEVLVIRRFFTASRLVLTVATIGLAQVLGGIQLLLPSALGGPPLVGSFPTPLSGAQASIDPVIFTGNDLLIIVVVPLVIAGLGYFLLRTDAGVAVRGAADNADRALLLGIPIRRLSTLVWVIGGVLAVLTTLLSAPSQGLTLSAAAGPTLLLPALAAAVVARMESLPVAFGAGVGLGVLDSLVRWNFDKQAVSSVAFLIVILLALLVLRRPGGRGEDSDAVFTAAGVFKPIPLALRRLPEVVTGRAVVGVVVAGAMIAVPLLAGASTTRLFSVAIVYAIAAVSLVVLSGWAGQISLGQFAIVGIGGVVVGDLLSRYNVDLFFALVAGGAAGALLAILVGLPALRIRGLFLAVTTLALAVAADSFFLNPTNFASLIPQSFGRPVLWRRFDLVGEKPLYYLCLGVLVVVIAVVLGLRQARAGRVMFATRDNERAAAAMAVPTTRVKLVGFVLAGAIAGVAGGLHATILQSIGFHTYEPSQSLLVFSMAVIGGLASITGALLGVGAVELAVHLFPKYQLIITGAGLLVLLLVLPGGLGELVQRLRDRALRLVARRRGLDVDDLLGERPSTLAPDPLADTAPLPRPIAAGVDGPALLRCQGVEVSYGQVQVLFGVDLEVAEGEIVALLGTNGAGKSTLLKAVSGLAKPGAGLVEFAGRPIGGTAADATAGLGLALMPGGRGIFPSLTVTDNLRLAGWLSRKDKLALAAARAEALDLFPVLEARLDQQAGDLSGGEQQMLSLAQALMGKPRLLMIDELSLGLAPTVVGQLIDVVRRLHDSGVTIVVVEQSVNVALELAERAVFMEKGEVRFAGPTADLLERPDILRSVFIAGASAGTSATGAHAAANGKVAANGHAVAPGAVTADWPAGPANGPAPANGSAAGNGRVAAAGTASRAQAKARVARAAEIADAPVVLECREVTKSFGGIRALGGVDLSLRKGEILGLIGHNGAGKTTLFDAICGFLPIESGRVLLRGGNIDHLSPADRAFAGLGRSFQEARLFPSLTVAETIAVAFERHLDSRDLVAAGLRLPASTDSEAAVAEKVGELIESMGLAGFAERLVTELSTGTRRIVELACVLAQDPSVVLLDEPSGGVAQRETEALGPLLKQVQQRSGCSLLVIEHDMPLLTSICDELVALELGEVIATGTPREVLEHPRVIESYLGTDDSTINRSGTRGRAGKPAKRRAASLAKR